MNKYELEKTIDELNTLAYIPWNEERCVELAKALADHYRGKDRKEDKSQLEIPFKKEQVIKK